MSIDPRTINAAVQRLMFFGVRRCTFRVTRANTIVSSGESWIGREGCGALATYATVKRGRVSPRCELHARTDAAKMGVAVNDEPKIEVPAKATTAPKPQRPDPGNPLNGIGCLTAQAARLFATPTTQGEIA